MDNRDIGCEDGRWMHLVQDRVQWRALLGESGVRRGTEVRRVTHFISARQCCLQLLMPGTNHPRPFLV
jgi:hypothetical protein